jgi:hypothetical protein
MPYLKSVTVSEKSNVPVNLKQLVEAGYVDGARIDVGYLVIRVMGAGIEVLELTEPDLLLWSDERKTVQALEIGMRTHFDGLLDRVYLGHLEKLVIPHANDFELLRLLFKITGTVKLPTLNSLRITYTINFEYFAILFNQDTVPCLKEAKLELIIPDYSEHDRLRDNLLPFLRGLKIMERMNLNIHFLAENPGRTRQFLMSRLDYPFLTAFEGFRQQLRVEDVEPFLLRHAGTLRVLDLGGNFLEEGLFDSLIKFNAILTTFKFTETALSVS